MKQKTESQKTKQIVARIPTQMARRIDLLAKTNKVTATMVLTKLLEVGFANLPASVIDVMDAEIARLDRDKRANDGAVATLQLSRMAKPLPDYGPYRD